MIPGIGCARPRRLLSRYLPGVQHTLLHLSFAPPANRWIKRTLPTSRPNRQDEPETHMTPPIVTTALAADPISACHKAIRDRWYRSPTTQSATTE